MTAHFHAAGQHSLHGVHALAGEVRRLVLWLLPPPQELANQQERSRTDWHAVGCAIGDLAEDFFSLLAIAAMVGLAAVLTVALAWLSMWALLVAGVVAAGAFGGWRLRVRVRRLEEEMSDGD